MQAYSLFLRAHARIQIFFFPGGGGGSDGYLSLRGGGGVGGPKHIFCNFMNFAGGGVSGLPLTPSLLDPRMWHTMHIDSRFSLIKLIFNSILPSNYLVLICRFKMKKKLLKDNKQQLP